ncbi:hypothetical protein HU200_051267 [Digitaria exilis]|uniref:Pentatricopeptide repeat-containing protein n=1 Tax=Digitaria exilis TaxID=1010633 RepID=A0A835AQV5_9POAL|nr:hypothetical protein HU200_051267 [Digitaria exilis]
MRGGFNSPWTLAIRAAADHGRPRRAVALYLSSLRASQLPCPFALAAVLKSVPRLPSHAALPAAACLHAHLLRVGLLSHPYPHAALSHVYSRLLPEAPDLLDDAPALRRESLLVSSNSLLASRLRAGDVLAARALFDAMPARDVVSWNTMVAGLAKAGHLGDLRFGLWVESFMGSVGVELDDHLRTALIDLYTKEWADG